MSQAFDELDMDPQPTLFVSVSCPTADIACVLSQILPRVRGYIEEKSIATPGLPFTRYIHWEGGTCTLEAGYLTEDSALGADEIRSGHLPGGRVLTTVHLGPYETLCEAYAAMEKRMAECGRKSGGHPWELYLTTPDTEPDDIQTQIFWPLR